ncbi:hypothetical protein TRV_05745, partial [Trichophyton verrucosum HKI 0517]
LYSSSILSILCRGGERERASVHPNLAHVVQGVAGVTTFMRMQAREGRKELDFPHAPTRCHERMDSSAQHSVLSGQAPGENIQPTAGRGGHPFRCRGHNHTQHSDWTSLLHWDRSGTKQRIGRKTMMEIKQIEIELLKLRLGSLGRGLLWLAGWLAGPGGGRVEQAALPCHHRHSEGQRDDDNSDGFFRIMFVKRSTTYHIRSRLLLHCM